MEVSQAVDALRSVDMLASKLKDANLAQNLDTVWQELQDTSSNLLNSAYDLMMHPLERDLQQTYLFHQQALDDIILKIVSFTSAQIDQGVIDALVASTEPRKCCCTFR